MVTDLHGFTIIHGNCPKGADKHAKWWAESSPLHNDDEFPEDRNDVKTYPDKPPFEHIAMPAEWDVHHPDWCSGECSGAYKERPHCSVAGLRRNQEMLNVLRNSRNESEELMVIAFTDKPLKESRGTYDMVERAELAGVPTLKCHLNP